MKDNFVVAGKKIKSRLDAINKKPKIGISWVSKNKKIGSGKSMDLNSLMPLFKIKDLSFVNLQYGNYSKEIKKFNNENNINIIDFNDIDMFNDFETLAGLLYSLDLCFAIVFQVYLKHSRRRKNHRQLTKKYLPI